MRLSSPEKQQNWLVVQMPNMTSSHIAAVQKMAVVIAPVVRSKDRRDTVLPLLRMKLEFWSTKTVTLT